MAGTSLEHVAHQIAHRVWQVVTSRPELVLLYTGYYVAVERAALETLSARFTPAMLTLDGRQIASWADDEGSEGFEGWMTEEIVEVLNTPLCRSLALSLVALEIPHAVRTTMSSHCS